jgi:arsenate reductase
MSPPMTLWFNPGCSKCRAALALLEARGVTPTVRRYLEEPPRLDELRALAKKLGASPRTWMRAQDALFMSAGLSDASSDDALFEALVKHPQLLERPILEDATRAVVARPPERVLELLPPQ